MNKATEGRPATNAHGALIVTTTVEHDGIAFRVSDGVQVVDELTKTFTDRDQAAAYYRHIAAAAAQGKRVYQIVWEVQALEEAQNAATGRTPEQVADAINAEVDAHHAETIETHNQTVEAVDEIMQGADYATWRRKVRAQAVAEATSSVTVAQNQPAPLDRIIREAANNGGVIIRSGLAKSTQILALVRARLAAPTYENVWERGRNVKRLSGAALTIKGQRRAAELNEVTA